VTILTAMPHERQDHKFTNPETGQPMSQVTTLKDVVNLLAKSDIDGVINIGGHSLRATEFGVRQEFPILPLDPTDWLIKISGFDQIPPAQRFVVGPDKGRKGTARKLAQWLHCPLASATKVRERMKEGYPRVTLPKEALEYIKEHNCIVAMLDDEIREGGTMGELAKLIGKYAKGIWICVLKGICAARKNKSAIDHLGNKAIKKVVMTDAVKPICDPAPIKHKLKVVSLKPEILSLIEYLKTHLVPDGPGWLQDPAVSLLKLDLTVEKTE
jgi:phosphoribosylpyrophosphate synthetase